MSEASILTGFDLQWASWSIESGSGAPALNCLVAAAQGPNFAQAGLCVGIARAAPMPERGSPIATMAMAAAEEG
eukprot:15432555-Alexandrium_andersonii.AAC.1